LWRRILATRTARVSASTRTSFGVSIQPTSGYVAKRVNAGRDSGFLRVAAICGLAVPLTNTIGWAVGGLVQPEAYSSTDDDISDLGAMTASSPWLYNQIGANLTGLLIVVLALGIWRALSPDTLGRVGAGTLLLVGVGVALDGLFRLDCQGIDTTCQNDSWHSDAHKMETRFTTAFTLLAPIILAFAFRRIAEWRDTWLPTLAAIPASIVIGILFSGLGVGAATRATALTWTLWAAFVGFRLLQKTSRPKPEPV
jgi:hypothetical membrane protein